MTKTKKTKGKLRERLLVLMIIFMTVLLIAIYFAPKIFIIIQPGQAGVIFKRLGKGTDTERHYNEGLNIIFPWNKMYIYNVRLQEESQKISVLTKDGLMVQMTVSVRFSANIKTVALLHKYIGPDYVEKVVLPEVKAKTKNVISDYDLEELYTENRDNIQKKLSYQVLEGLNEQILIEDNHKDSTLLQRMGLTGTGLSSRQFDSIAYENKLRSRVTELLLAGVNQPLSEDDSIIVKRRQQFFSNLHDSTILQVSGKILNDNADLKQVMGDSLYNRVMPTVKKDILIDSLIDVNKEEQYIIFGDLFITDIQLPDEVANIIEDKIVAEQQYRTYKYKLDIERSEAERKRIEALGIQAFDSLSGISILKWRGLEVTEKLAKSPNTKLVIMGTDESLPIILNGEVADTTRNRN